MENTHSFFLSILILFTIANSSSSGNQTPTDQRSLSDAKRVSSSDDTRTPSDESFMNETILSFTGDERVNLIYGKNSFTGLSKLKKLTLSNMSNMTIFPDLSGTSSLEVLRIDRSDLTIIPATICEWSPKLKSLIIKSNRIQSIPILDGCTELRLLDLSYNEITSIGDSRVQYFRNQSKLIDLILNHNSITELNKDSFIGLHNLQVLNLEGNKIKKIHPNVFDNVKQLRDLNLASNQFSHLPTTGLTNLRQIKVFNSPNLKEFPSPESFPRIQTLALSYSYHCCSYLKLNLDYQQSLSKVSSGSDHNSINGQSDLTETILWLPNKKKNGKTPATGSDANPILASIDNSSTASFGNRGNGTNPILDSSITNMIWDGGGSGSKNVSNKSPSMNSSSNSASIDGPSIQSASDNIFRELSTDTSYYDIDQLWKNILAGNKDYNLAYNQYIEEYFEDYKNSYADNGDSRSSTNYVRYPIQCLPQPGPFMPCEDLFGWWTLRCGVWLVFLLALLGNGVVVVVLIFGRSKIDVPRFLVCNLAMADFFMGLYLGILAIVDAVTLGEFKAFAVIWQTSSGCQIAGFLGVFSSELSVYTLAVITLERNYAITHAMHLNKRLSLKHASYIMTVGWIFALIMAVLPLFGISDYRKFAVCLPFEVEKDSASLTYVVSLITLNGVAFFTLMGCYLRMYLSIRGSQAWNSNDTRIAKRMALLVFTDFLCWAPIAFFSATAIAGYNLISLEEAKVFTIFILPLNSCCNPFLYAIFTKKFKKDCILLCKRIEESRFTRGLGRGRHSSNFSNRQTPVNSNSAADRRSGSQLNTMERKVASDKLAVDASNIYAKKMLIGQFSGTSGTSSNVGGYCKCGHSLVASNKAMALKINAKTSVASNRRSPISATASASDRSPNKSLYNIGKYFWTKTPSNQASTADILASVDKSAIINPRTLSPKDRLYRDTDANQRLLSDANQDADAKKRSGSVSSDTNFSSSTANSFKHTIPIHARMANVHERYQKRPITAVQLRAQPHNKRLHSHDSNVSNSTFKTSSTRASVSSNNSSRTAFHSTATDSTTIPLSRSVSAVHKSLEQSISANSTSYGSSDVILGEMDTPEVKVIRPSSLFSASGQSSEKYQESSESGSRRPSDDIELGNRISDHRRLERKLSAASEQKLCHECARQEALLAKKKAKNKNKPKRNHIRLDDLELEDKMNRYFKKLTIAHESNQRAHGATASPSELKALKVSSASSESKDSTLTNSFSSEGDAKNKSSRTNDSSSSQVTNSSHLSSCASFATDDSNLRDRNINEFFLKCEKQPYIRVGRDHGDDTDHDAYHDHDIGHDAYHDHDANIYLFVDRDEGESNSRSPSTISVRTAVQVGGARDSRAGTLTPTDLEGQGSLVNVTRSLVDVRKNLNHSTSDQCQVNLTADHLPHVYSSSASASSCQLSTDAKRDAKVDAKEDAKEIKIKKKGSKSESSLRNVSNSLINIPIIVWRSLSSQDANRTSINSQGRGREGGSKKGTEEPLLK